MTYEIHIVEAYVWRAKEDFDEDPWHLFQRKFFSC